MFKLQSPSKYSPLDAVYLLRCFNCSKQFLNLSILMPFSASAVFCFTSSSTSAKCFPLRTFFIKWNKNSHSGWDWVNREGGIQGLCHVLVKNCWTLSALWASVLVNPHHEICKFVERIFKKKNLLKPNAASHNNASWHTDTHEFLEHSSGSGS